MTISDDIRVFLSVLLLVVGGILPIVNPVGSAPIFLAMTHGSDVSTRQLLAVKVAINAFILIMGSLVFGAFVLKIFGLSVPVVQVAGGAVLCALGWNMLNSDTAPSMDPQPVQSDAVILRAFYPLTLPLTVDPGAISVAITIGANHAHGVERILVGLGAATLGTTIIAVSVWLAYRYAPRVAQWLGHSRLMVVLRLSAFIVLCIGVEITWNGVRALAAQIEFAPPSASTAKPPAHPAQAEPRAP
jgi:multiple antibiotic resistance protein